MVRNLIRLSRDRFVILEGMGGGKAMEVTLGYGMENVI